MHIEVRELQPGERKIFEVESSRMSDNVLLASRTKITFVVDPYTEEEGMFTSESHSLLPNSEFMLVNEFIIQKLQRFAWHSEKLPCFIQRNISSTRY